MSTCVTHCSPAVGGDATLHVGMGCSTSASAMDITRVLVGEQIETTSGIISGVCYNAANCDSTYIYIHTYVISCVCCI